MQADLEAAAEIAPQGFGAGWVVANAVALCLGNTLFIAAHDTDLVWPTRTLAPITLAALLQFGLFGLAQAIFLRRIGFRPGIWVARTAVAGGWWGLGGLVSPSNPGYWTKNPGAMGLEWPAIASLKIALFGMLLVCFVAAAMALASTALQSARMGRKLPRAWFGRRFLGWFALFLFAFGAEGLTGPEARIGLRLLVTAAGGFLGGACFGLLTAGAFRAGAPVWPGFRRLTESLFPGEDAKAR